MEIRQNVARVPTRPIAFVITLLALVALAITGWSVLRTSVVPPATTLVSNPAYSACNGLGPDAQERCILTIQEQQSKPELTHGH